jgi:hypothetical protein
LNQENDANDKTTETDKDSLPIGEGPLTPPLQQPVTAPPPSPVIQQNIGPNFPDSVGRGSETENGQPLPVRVVNEPLLTRGTDDNELSTFEHRTLRYARWGFFVAAITLLVVGGTGIVFWGQLREMATQTDLLGISARQARRDSAGASLATGKQIGIAQQQAKAAQDSVCALKHQLQQQQRAWIKVSYGTMNADFPIIVSQEVTFINVGNTPAQDVEAWMAIIPIDPDMIPRFDLSEGFVQRNGFKGGMGFMFTNDRYPVNVRTKYKLDLIQTDRIHKGLLDMLTYGRVTYVDIFKVHHWLNFCSAPKIALLSAASEVEERCLKYETTDNNQVSCGN